MNIIYLGTPKFAVEPLNALMQAGHNIVAVVTQIDKANARGNKIVFSEVKTFALENNLPLYQFQSIKKEGVEVLKGLGADVMVTASYGQILSKEVLDICKYGVLNIHASLLPALRGASPVASALLLGEEKTGVTIMQTDVGLDNGKMLLRQEVQIDVQDNQVTLMEKLSALGAKMIVKVLADIDAFRANACPQNEGEATHCKKITKQDGLICFSDDATAIHNKVRAFYGNPTAYFVVGEEKFKVFQTEVVNREYSRCGVVEAYDKQNGFVVSCKNGGIKILKLQKPGGKVLAINDFMNGFKFEVDKELK